MDIPNSMPFPSSDDSEGSVLRRPMDLPERTDASHRLPQFLKDAPAEHGPDDRLSQKSRNEVIGQNMYTEEQPQSRRHSNGSALRERAFDPGPSERRSQRSQQSYHEPTTTATIPEPGHPASAVNMPEHFKSLYSDDSEGPILRAFVDAQFPQEISSQPGRASVRIQDTLPEQLRPASQGTPTISNSVLDPGRSKRQSHRRSHSNNDVVVPDASSTKELIRHLMEQKKETNTLRRALRLAVERMDAEAQRVVALERENHLTIDQFMALNESKIAAQREAMKASSELRLYQFQLDNANKEILRAQDELRSVENQRDEAEAAATRARARARKHMQEQMLSSAKEEGRRLGFEAGLKRAQEEAGYSNPGSRRGSDIQGRIEDLEFREPLLDVDLDTISSPVHRRTPRAQRQELAEQPPSPPNQPQVQPPTPPDSEDETTAPTDHDPFTQRPQDIARTASPGPSIQRYSISIPPASELERHNSQNQYLGKSSSQPWVTAQEFHQLTGLYPVPNNAFQSNPANTDVQRGSVTFALPQQMQSGKKEGWLRRTLSRPWRKSTKRAQYDTGAPGSSWYQPMPARPQPAVHVRDFGVPDIPRSSFDSNSVSTRVSQLEIVSPPPNTTSDGSEQSLRAAPKSRRRVRGKDSVLSVINEDPLSRTATPVRGNVPRGSPRMEEIQTLLSQSNGGDAKSTYSNPKAVDEWRRSSASSNQHPEMDPVNMPSVASRQNAPPPSVTSRQSVPPPSVVSRQSAPRRRPAYLTVPSPLSPSNALPPRPRAMSNNTQNSAFLGTNDIRLGLQRHPTSGTIDITVVPPSRSPTEAPNSARTQGDFLSPRHSLQPSVRPAPSLRNTPRTPSPLAPQQDRLRPGSVGGRSEVPASLQMDRPQSQQQWPDQPRRSSTASHSQLNVPSHHVADNASVRSGGRSIHNSHNTPRQSYSNLPSISPEPATGNPSAHSHRRTVSNSTYLVPNPGTSVHDEHRNEGHSLHRVPSNQSMSSVHSANSQYAHFDPTTYREPTELFNAVTMPTPGGLDVPRTQANASTSTLSYI